MVTDRVLAQLARDYTGLDRDAALELVQGIHAELSAWKIVSEGDRVEVAALTFADGRLPALHDAVALAVRDWRDLLVAVGNV